MNTPTPSHGPALDVGGPRGPRIVVRMAVLLMVLSAPAAQTAARRPVEISVYAASSLTDVMQALAPACARAVGVRLSFNFGASSDLAHQITAAGKADLFISADEDWMDRVERAGLLKAGSRRRLLSNSLVVVARSDSPLQVADAEQLASAPIRFYALAEPDAVPAGKYARAWLRRAGQWHAIAGRVLPAVNVRAALAAVAAGMAEAGIVYKTDAAISAKVRVLFEVPCGEAPRIVYPAAVLRDRPHARVATAVIDWLAGPAARETIERFGFIPLSSSREGPP